MTENIIPYIGGEEEKSEQEPLRVLGHVENGEIVKAELPRITCQCIRVPVLDGHTAAVFINFEKKPSKEELSHNTVRGAAGGAVLCAEALTKKGYISAK